MYIMIVINTDRSGVRYQSSGAQIRNQISVFENLWHRDVRYKICTAQGCHTAQTRRHRDALHIYGTGMPRHGDAFIYIY